MSSTLCLCRSSVAAVICSDDRPTSLLPLTLTRGCSRILTASTLCYRARQSPSCAAERWFAWRSPVPKLREDLLETVIKDPGKTDRELTNQLRGRKAPQQPINQAARSLEEKGILIRRKRPEDGLIGNYPGDISIRPVRPAVEKKHDVDALSEDQIKQILDEWLQSEGWTTQVAWGRTPGIDIDAIRKGERWVIEVKGPGSSSPMRVNYFIGILGETLQRMDDPSAHYSIALPNLKQYRDLWDRLPDLAKSRTGISLLLVSNLGAIEQLK